MLAFGSERGIEERGNGDVEIGSGGEFAVLGGVKGALEIIGFGADVDAAGERFEEAVGGDGVGERGEGWEIAESEMNFRDGAVRTEIADAQSERRIDLRRIDEVEEGALGVEAGNDRIGGNFFAASEDEASDGAIFDADVADFGVGADFGADMARGFRECARERAEPSVRKRSGADGMRVGSGAQEENRRGARRPGTKRGAKNSARGDNGANELGVEKFGGEIGGGHRSPAEKVEEPLFAETANAAAGFEKIPEILGRGRIDVRRRDGEKLAENGEEFREGVGKFGVLAGVFGGEPRDAAGGFGVIVVEEKGLPVGRGSEEARIGMEHVALELLELHVRGDIGAERTDGVRERRSAKAGMKFLGDGAAADKFAALEDERLEAALS